MKKTNDTYTTKLLNRFDNELKAILFHDLKQFRKAKGQFLRNTSTTTQVPDSSLLVA